MATSKNLEKPRKTSKNLEKDKTLCSIVEALKKEFSPVRLFLFGSRASGKHCEDSDYDFVLVQKKTSGNRADNMIRASKAIRHLGVDADVFVFSESEFDDWKNELSSIPETALNTGREISLG
jgi:predicted nucleotidyltransferase